MKVPVSWLREYVDVDATPEDIAEKLTFSGVEVEGIATVGSDYEGIVVGKVLAIEPHPGADRLRLCRVSDGTHERRVVCGADNFDVGDKAPFAGIGATLPNGMTIKRAKIRGEESEGMLCAEDELGLSEDHTGIMLLPREIAEGTSLSDVLGPPDTVLDLEITWNRPDCLSIIGMAREVAALYGKRLRPPSVEFPEEGQAVEDLAQVSLEDSEGCPRYTARVLSGVTLGPSPVWMQQRLRLCGVRPINNVVDITNYVMLECGQPLHAFDYTLLADHHIIVRRARPGETMATLDEVERDITPEMLLIADAERPVAVAGVMGGAGSEIRDDTETVLLESAHFSPPSIRSTSSALSLQTESSHRFERGVNIDAVEWCSRRAAKLIVDLSGATAARGVIDAYPNPVEPHTITCRYQRLRDLVGVDVADDQIVRILESLELTVESSGSECCTVRIPVLRGDLQIEADIIEEVARMAGLDCVPAAVPQAMIVPDATDAPTRARQALRSRLVGLGLTETMNYSFLSSTLLDLFSTEDRERRVVLPNAVSAEYGVLRNSLIPQMVESLGRNLSHQSHAASFFELGRVFETREDGSICEEERLCIGLMGPVGRTGIAGRTAVEHEEIFLWIKGVVEALFYSQHIDGLVVKDISEAPFEAGWSVAALSGDRSVGRLGIVDPSVRHQWRMSEPVAVAELRVASLMEGAADARELVPLSAYPAVNRDVALIVDDTVTHADIVRVIAAAAPPELTGTELFDIYKNVGMGAGKRSLAYSLTYRSLERNLTDEDANGYHEAIKAALKKELNAEIRDT